jgi:hypothetical protein
MWSRDQLSQEIGLRSRRVLHKGLASLGLDLDDGLLNRWVFAVRSTGLKVLDVLSSELPAEHFVFLTSDLCGGAQGAVWARKLPMLAGAPHEYVTSLARMINGGPALELPSPLLTAGVAFHLAASLFDLVGDGVGEIDALLAYLPEQGVANLLDAGDLERTLPPDRSGVPEIGAFAATLRLFVATITPLERWPLAETLRDCVMNAYRVQAASLRPRRSSADDVAISLGKSREVYRLYATMVAGLAPTPQRDTLIRIGSTTGELFALVDDLVDVADDVGQGHVNAVLAPLPPGAGGEPVTTLEAVLESNAIEQTVEQVLDRIEALVVDTRDPAFPPAAGEELLRMILASVRAWTL